MKLGKLVDQTLVKLLNDLNGTELPAALAYKVGKLVNKAAEEQKEYFKLREALIEKYAHRDDEGKYKTTTNASGQQIIDFGDNVEAFYKEITELDQTDVTIDIKIPLAALDKAGFQLTGGQINDLIAADLLQE